MSVEETIKGRDGEEITVTEAQFSNEGIAELEINDKNVKKGYDTEDRWAVAILTVESAHKLYTTLGDLLTRYGVPR